MTNVAFLCTVGTSYKFRVVAVNVIGSSPPSAPSKAYTVVGGRTNERPVDGPYITYNEAINETTIILKWTVSSSKGRKCVGLKNGGGGDQLVLCALFSS